MILLTFDMSFIDRIKIIIMIMIMMLMVMMMMMMMMIIIIIIKYYLKIQVSKTAKIYLRIK